MPVVLASEAAKAAALGSQRPGHGAPLLDRVDVGGYALISADAMELATAIAATAPHTKLRGGTIVWPVMAQADVPGEAPPHPSGWAAVRCPGGRVAHAAPLA
jgi:hypothetical protein